MIYHLKEKANGLPFQNIQKRNKVSFFKKVFLIIAFISSGIGWAQTNCGTEIKGASYIIKGFTTTTLTASGAQSYMWTSPAGLSDTVASSVIVRPETTTTYTVKSNDGCTAVFTVTVIDDITALSKKVNEAERSVIENKAIKYLNENPLKNCKLKRAKRLVNEMQGNVIAFDFCQFNTDPNLYAILRDLNLKKGDLFAVKIANINPYLYNINVTVKNDTIKSGTVPALFSAFMDVSQLGTIASNITALTAPATVSKSAAAATAITSTIIGYNEEKLTTLTVITESHHTNFASPLDSLKALVDTLQKKIKKNTATIVHLKKELAADSATIDSLTGVTVDLKKQLNRDSIVIDSLKNVIVKLTRRNSIMNLIEGTERMYNGVNRCYTNSVLSVYNTQIDCPGSNACLINEDCNCVNDIKANIDSLARNKYLLIDLLNTKITEKSKSLPAKKPGKKRQADTTDKFKITQDSLLSLEYNKLYTELQSSKYSLIYLNKIYTKAYSNFLIAKNMANLSTYYSFPIQVQGDEIELKIDITPKAAAKVATDTTKNKSAASSNASTSSMSNQSPVTVNINTDTKTTPTNTASANGKAADPGAGKTAAAPAKKDSSGTQDVISSDELKVSMPLAAREYHLNYKYRTSLFWYGFSTGFFADWLRDDNYINKPVTPTSSTTTYTLVQQNAKKNSPSQYGIMASVNGGLYFSKKHDWFGQVFAGPGLSIQTKLQPCLLIGGGVGCGSTNKFSVNAGMVIGQVQRLSADLDTGQATAAPQTISYYSTNAAAFFVSVNYVFNF